jgi:hypothetical protein
MVMLWSIADALSRIVRHRRLAAEYVMGIGDRELYPVAEAGAHLAGDNTFKHIVRVKFYDRCERA